MRTVCVLALLSGVAALQKPGYGEIMKMTLKSRAMTDVTLDMEASEATDVKVDDSADGSIKGAFAGFVIMTAGVVLCVYFFTKTSFAVSVEHENEERSERGLDLYNKVAPALMATMGVIMFCAVIGSAMKINAGAYSKVPKSNVPGYEGQKVLHDKISNPAERAFFAGAGLVIQAFLGAMICLYLRKSQDVQITTAMIMKMGLRGAAAGTFATMFVEFVRLPFHDYMMSEDLVIGRVMVVLVWVAFVALMEEILKIASVGMGLKRSENDEEAISANPAAHYIAESAQALAICGLAAGMGFAFVENIPRFYSMALQQPLVGISYDYFGQGSETTLVGEDSLRSARIWTFFFWGLLNLQPWLTGLAAMQLAKLKAPISAMDWVSVIKFVVLIHFIFDLFDRSANLFVELLGCCTIPYAMHTFFKQWKSMEDSPAGLIENRE